MPLFLINSVYQVPSVLNIDSPWVGLNQGWLGFAGFNSHSRGHGHSLGRGRLRPVVLLLPPLLLVVVAFDTADDLLGQSAPECLGGFGQRSDGQVLAVLADAAEAHGLASNRCPESEALSNPRLDRDGPVAQGQELGPGRCRQGVVPGQAAFKSDR